MLGNKEIAANYFGIEKPNLAEERNNKSKIGKKINVLNEVISNNLIGVIQNIARTNKISNKAANIKNLPGIKINDDLMSPKKLSGDISIIRYQKDAELSNMVITLIGNNTATYKKTIKCSGGISLISFRPTYFIEQNIYCKSIQIIGKVLKLRGNCQ